MMNETAYKDSLSANCGFEMSTIHPECLSKPSMIHVTRDNVAHHPHLPLQYYVIRDVQATDTGENVAVSMVSYLVINIPGYELS